MKSLALCLLATLLSSAPSAAAASAFVKTNGTHFELDGKPFYFQGTNAARLSIIEGDGEDKVYAAFRQYAAKGLKVVRVWGFSCRGEFYGEPMLESVSARGAVYNARGMERLDATLDAARAAGLKIILPLVNFEPSYCGIDWWTKQITGSGDKQDFYKDTRVQNAFKAHVGTLLNRVNTRYRQTIGEDIRYRDDPTIMAIEVMNEPHTQDGYDYSGNLLLNFLTDITAYIRSQDGNHLICSGDEGYQTALDPKLDTYEHTWINNGLKGVDYARNLYIANVDFATVHLYPDNWDINAREMDWVRQHLVQRRADMAHAAGKPIVLEEAGFSADSSWHPWLGYWTNPAYYLSEMYKYANAADYAGTMIWELMPDGYAKSGYVYTFSDPVAGVVFQQAAYMNQRAPAHLPVP